MALLLLLSVFFAGALAVIALEAAGLWILICRLSRKVEREDVKAKDAMTVSTGGDLNTSSCDKQGALWVLEPDKVLKSGLEDKVSSEQRRRKEILEVTPVRKYGRVRDHYLMLLEPDNSHVKILLKGCKIVTVSATNLSSRKWAKRYPIKVESKDSAIYKGHKILYIYLETSLEKESWCNALRVASCGDELKTDKLSNLSKEFQDYLASLNAGYPSFLKPSPGFNTESTSKSAKLENSSSRVRHFLKKFTKKASRSVYDYKGGGISISGQEERRTSGKSHSFQDLTLDNGSTKNDSARKSPNISLDDSSSAPSSISTSTKPGPGSNSNGLSDGDSNKYIDEGTLCLNVLMSRLFFDVKINSQIRSSIQARIQRTLSSMRIPSYIGEVTCIGVDPGTLPPNILAMRVLPSDMNEFWAMELDIEYLGGMLLHIKTRIELQELEFEGEEAHMSGNTPAEVTSDLLDDFEHLGKQLKLSDDMINEIKHKAKGDHDKDESGNSKGTSSASPPSQGLRWKSVLHSITKQVSQVPIALGIRVSSLYGTIQLRIKPPPADQIWFGFTSMPEIQFNLDSFVGDHKITNGHLALLLISRLKVAIRETLVLPNFENIEIPWMIADKEDWIPRKDAPFMWNKNNQDSASNATKQEVPPFQRREGTSTVEAEVNNEIPRSVPLDHSASSTSSMNDLPSKNSSFGELTAPLLNQGKMQEIGTEDNRNDIVLRSSSQLSEGQYSARDDEAGSRRTGTRERMRGLGKKMGERLEVKRRHLEERGRNFVEKMRGPS